MVFKIVCTSMRKLSLEPWKLKLMRTLNLTETNSPYYMDNTTILSTPKCYLVTTRK